MVVFSSYEIKLVGGPLPMWRLLVANKLKIIGQIHNSSYYWYATLELGTPSIEEDWLGASHELPLLTEKIEGEEELVGTWPLGCLIK